MKMTTLAARAFALPAFPVFAGPFEFDDNEHLIPKD